MDNREYAYIFDYTCSGIYEAELNDETRDLDTEALLDYYNLSIDNCYVMFSDKKLEIETLTKED